MKSPERLRLVSCGFHPWSPLWKRHQSMVAHLARGSLIERAVFLGPHLRLSDLPRRFRTDWRGLDRQRWLGMLPRSVAPRVVAWTPVFLRPGTRAHPEREAANLDTIIRVIVHCLRGEPDVLLINNPMSEEQPIVEALAARARLRILDWSDDFAQIPTVAAAQQLVGSIVERILGRVDLVLAVNEALGRRARTRGVQTAVVPNATGMNPVPGPPQSRAACCLREIFPRPILGYAGFLTEHRIDLAIVEHLARTHAGASLVFLGPVYGEFHRRFPPLPNIHFLDPVPHRELQDHLHAFDVCVLPHLVNAHTAGNDPIKLYDYLSTGRPVVATPVAGTERLTGVVRVARTPAGFSAEVEAALRETDPGAEALRLATARRNTWATRIVLVEEAIREAWAAHAS